MAAQKNFIFILNTFYMMFLFARGDDIQKVVRGKVLVHELVVADQMRYGFVLLGQQAPFDTHVIRPGDVQDVRVVGSIRSFLGVGATFYPLQNKPSFNGFFIGCSVGYAPHSISPDSSKI